MLNMGLRVMSQEVPFAIALRPLPDKFHDLQDQELLIQQRHKTLDQTVKYLAGMKI
jgi:lysyl-tRNA synthetase class II